MKLNFFLSAALFSGSFVLGLADEPKTAPVTSNLEALKDKVSELYYDNDVYNLEAIDARLQECPVVIDLNNYIREESLLKDESFVEKLFTKLFPFGPAGNSILATSYISGPPNFLLALIPPNINPASLNTLVSFAIGGLLGDVFLHLLPQTFVGEVHDEGARFLIVDEKRNTILGLAMFVGFLAFIILDKGMRIMGAGHDHSHDKITVTHKKHVEVHGHVEEEEVDSKGKSSSVEKKQATKRNAGKDKVETDIVDSYEISKEESGPSSSIKLSAYLNLIADFTHNITDGLAIAASFYISKSIPHEVGDFALLIQGGFSKSQAMQAQFVTAIGAFLGTFLGIGINYLTTSGTSTSDSLVSGAATGIFGTNVLAGDLVLPFTAGGFLYIGTVGVIPEILEADEDLSRFEQVKRSLINLMAMLVGIGLMFIISWNE
ncbi:hypothetical protein D0Z00_000647 [Geotrichum galactomycetum]|uniref:Uncharacterized protein n=1 Tax=Geotrichum galactomycetum TaxID=27317 RepID=A0ACB6V946_9ASCO|nr:hypothetical protein D0Z00_000647 [Geotrichum candidum]